MQEPSVWDYVKSKLAFWRESTLELPAGNPFAEPAAENALADPSLANVSATDAPAPGVTPVPPAVTAAADIPTDPLRRKLRFPWLPLGALFLALLGQVLLEPPDRSIPWAVIFYLIASVLILVAYWRGDVQPVLPPSGAAMPDNMRIHWEGLAIGALLMLLTFATFGAPDGQAHDFNFLNTALWLLSIGYLVWTFAIPRRNLGWDRLKNTLRQRKWKITITRWGLLLLAIIGIVLVYRFYHLSTLPAEMVSDHAEKLLDVQDVLSGQLHVFFPRNTGREFFQFYWTVLMIKLFQIPVSFMALKVGTVLAGLITLGYIYRLGLELGNKWVAMLALAFCGVSYWANIMSRIGLRFPLYPLFTAPLLFYLFRGFRNANRNDFIKAGLVLGLGLHGYTSYRIVPLLVVVAFGLYILHEKSGELRKRALMGLAIVSLISLAVFMPLLRYAVDDPTMFGYRALTRMSSLERPLPGSPVQIFFSNVGNALAMFQYDNGDVWVHSVTHRPALDVGSAALFFLGAVIVLARYVRRRHWLDLFLLVSIPILLLPSILSLAFPNENPNLNRTAAAYIIVFLILAIFLDALLRGFKSMLPGRLGLMLGGVVALSLFGWACWQNYDLLFVQYDASFRQSAGNATEMGAEIRAFEALTRTSGSAYVVAFPYWVDTRLVGIESGHPASDLAIQPPELDGTIVQRSAKLFLLKPEDGADLKKLQGLYPQGRSWLFTSVTPGKDFMEFMVLAGQ